MQTRVFTEPIMQSPERVWSFLADLSNDALWRDEIKEVHLVSGTRREKGAVYRETVQWQQFRSDVTLSIIDSVEATRLAVSSEGTAYRSRSMWTFEPMADGTLLTLVFTMEASGPYALAESVITDMIARWLERDLPKLGGHLRSL